MKARRTVLNNEKGVILVISLLILALLIGDGAGTIVSTQTDLKTSSNLKTATMAFYLAEAGVERAKSEISGSKTFNSALAGADGNKSNTRDNGILSFGSSVSFGGGTYAVRVTDNSDGDNDSWADADGKVLATSTGTYGSSTRTIKVLISKASMGFNGAINVVDDKCETEQGGLATVTGLDYTYNPSNQNNPTRASGPDAHAIARSCTTNNDQIQKPNQLTGVGSSTPDISSDIGSLTLSSLQSMRDDLIATADTTYNGNTTLSSNLTLGTRTSPTITYVNGSLTVSGNVTGVGFLIVNGAFKVTGNFTYEGIVLIGICSTCPGKIDGTENAKIYWAIVLANPTSTDSGEAEIDDMSGNSAVYYSTYAIDLAIKKTFKTLSWQDVSN